MAGKKKSSSSFELLFLGIDKTAGIFGAIRKRLNALGGYMKRGLTVAGGIGAGAVAGFAVAAKSAMNAMNQLGDTAQRAGVSASWLQKMEGAMGQAGIALGAEEITAAMQKMNAAIANPMKEAAFEKLGFSLDHLKGLKPEEAFTGLLKSVAKVGNDQERLLILQKMLGEAGMKMAPLLMQGPEAFSEGLEGVMGMISVVSDESVDVATRVNNAFALAGDSIKKGWFEVVGQMLQILEANFGDMEENVHKWFANFKLGAKIAGYAFLNFGITLKDTIVNIGMTLAAFPKHWREILTFLWEYLKHWGTYILDFFKSLGKAIWSFLKGDGFDLDGIVNTVMEFNQKKAPTLDIGIKWQKSEKFDLSEEFARMKADTDKEIELKVSGVRAKKQLASAFQGAVDPLGEKLKGKVSKGVKEGLASAVESDSYEVFKTIFAAGGNPGGAAASATASQSAKSERLSTEGNRTLASMLAELKEHTRLLRSFATV